MGLGSILNAEQSAAANEFDELQAHHRMNLAVEWRVCPPHPKITGRDAFYFSHFRRLRGAEIDKKGNGRIALAEVCAIADRYGIRLDLDTHDVEQAPKLHVYYKSFGFRKTKVIRRGYGTVGFTRAPQQLEMRRAA